jgi:hypothetical protein
MQQEILTTNSEQFRENPPLNPVIIYLEGISICRDHINALGARVTGALIRRALEFGLDTYQMMRGENETLVFLGEPEGDRLPLDRNSFIEFMAGFEDGVDILMARHFTKTFPDYFPSGDFALSYVKTL